MVPYDRLHTLICVVIFFRILIHPVYRNALMNNTFPGDNIISELTIKDITNSVMLVQGVYDTRFTEDTLTRSVRYDG